MGYYPYFFPTPASLPSCRMERKLHGKDREMTTLQKQLTKLEEELHQERKEVGNL